MGGGIKLAIQKLAVLLEHKRDGESIMVTLSDFRDRREMSLCQASPGEDHNFEETYLVGDRQRSSKEKEGGCTKSEDFSSGEGSHKGMGKKSIKEAKSRCYLRKNRVGHSG